MLAVLQFPLSDIRQFLSSETRRLLKPAWPVPRAGRDFVRGFGPLCRRSLGGIEDWPGEDYYCEAWRAFRLAEGWRASIGTAVHPQSAIECAFRRLLADGTAVARVEVAFEVKGSEGNKNALSALNGVRCNQFLRGLANIPVRTMSSQHRSKNEMVNSNQTLGTIGDILASRFLQSTTARKCGPPFRPQPTWVQACEPLLVVQHRQDQIDEFPKRTLQVDLPTAGFQLRYLRWSNDDVLLSVWFLGIAPTADRDFGRRLRLHLLRLHAELECLRQVLRSIIEHQLSIGSRTEAADNLQRYLANSIRLLSRESRYGVPQSELLKVVLSSRELVNKGERETLLGQCTTLRRNILRMLKEFTQSSNLYTSVIVEKGDVIMSRDKYEIGQAGAVGPGAHAENITFNQIWNKSAGSVDLHALASELADLRTELAKQASDPDQYVDLGAVAAAEKSARNGDGPSALEHLKKAGGWVWDVATKIGIGVATAAAKTALGI